MPVKVNEFEVVADQARQPDASPQSERSVESPLRLSPRALLEALRRERDRRNRLSAW